jgi:hypothetical protein
MRNNALDSSTGEFDAGLSGQVGATGDQWNSAEISLRTRLIEHLINMKKLDIEYAREAFKFYDALLPWLELGAGIKEAICKK